MRVPGREVGSAAEVALARRLGAAVAALFVFGRVGDFLAALAEAKPFVVDLSLGGGAAAVQVAGEAVGAGARARLSFAPLEVVEPQLLLPAACLAVAARFVFELTRRVAVEQCSLHELPAVFTQPRSLTEPVGQRCYVCSLSLTVVAGELFDAGAVA